VVGLDPVVSVLLSSVLGRWEQLLQHHRIGRRPVGNDLCRRQLGRADGPRKEPVRRRCIPPWRHLHVNDLAELLLDGDEWLREFQRPYTRARGEVAGWPRSPRWGAAGPRSTATWTPRAANLGKQATRGHGSGPYPVMTRIQMRAGLDLLPTWALEQKAAANRQVIAVMRQRLAAGEEVARMYQDPGLAWLERQADVAEDLVARRKRTAENRPGS